MKRTRAKSDFFNGGNAGWPSLFVAAICFLSGHVHAQAPVSVTGDGFLQEITYGVYPFANYGYYIFLPANSGNTYQVINIYNVANSSGTYSYAQTSASSANMNFSDSAVGTGAIAASFTSSSSGTFVATVNAYPGSYQSGYFNFTSANAPTSLIGKRFLLSVYDGSYPFAYTGSCEFRTAASGNTYTVIGDGINVASSSGTYTYSLANRSTGKLQISDSVTGTSTVYIGYVDSTSGGYAVTQPSTSGFQIGEFVVLDSTPPNVSVSSPATGTTYTNAQSVTITATASDNVGVVNVAFYDGSLLKGNDASAPYAYNWSFTSADNGAHSWTARAYDAAGNIKTSSVVTLNVSIDITPPLAAITVPTNGQNVAAANLTVSGTASDVGSPASGLNRVEVRLNGGSWLNATGTTSWTRSVTLTPCTNVVEARSLDKAGNYSTVVSRSVFYTPANTVPAAPVNLSPANGDRNVPITPLLQASAFNDSDCIGDTHAASQWQVLSSAGTVIVADSGTDTVNRLSWLVPTNRLFYGSNYQWHVRYRDSRNGWSSYSTNTRFTNGGPMLISLKQGMNIVFKWPTNAPGFTLQWSTNLNFGIWSNATPAAVVVSDQYTVTNNMTGKSRFYRLKK